MSGLFSRLDALADDMPARRRGDDARAAIRENLAVLLGTHLGNAPTVPDYGLADFNDLAARFPDLVRAIRDDIGRCVEAYEPRLSHVVVHHRPTGGNLFALSFELEATMVGLGVRTSFRLDLGGGRRLRIGA